MIRFVDGTIDPLLWFLVDWSIRWGVLIIGLAVWFRARPPRRAATRHLCCATALAVGLFLPLAPRWAAPWAWPRPHDEAAPASEQPVIEEPGPGPIHTADRGSCIGIRASGVARSIAAPVQADQRPINLAVPVASARGPARGRPQRAWGRGAGRVSDWRLLWLAGAGVALAQIVVGRGVLARLRSSSRPVALATVARCRCELDSRRLATLGAHPAVGSPVVLGGLAPLHPRSRRLGRFARGIAAGMPACTSWPTWSDATTSQSWPPRLRQSPSGSTRRSYGCARLDREAELACDDVAVGRGVPPLELARLLAVFAAKPFRLNVRLVAISRQALTFFDRNTVADRITRLLEDDMNQTIIPASKFKSLGQAANRCSRRAGDRRGTPRGDRARATPPRRRRRRPTSRARPRHRHDRSRSSSKMRRIDRSRERPWSPESLTATMLATSPSPGPVMTVRPGLIASQQPAIWIVAFKKGHSFTFRSMLDETGAIRTQVVLPRSRSLAGTVADAEGRPIALAEVRVEAVQESKERVYHFAPAFAPLVAGTLIERAIVARSDAQGSFRFESLPDESIVSLKISADGKATMRTQVPPSSTAAAGELEAVTRIVLAPEAKVAGQVVSAIPGVSVAGRAVTLQGVFEGYKREHFRESDDGPRRADS